MNLEPIRLGYTSYSDYVDAETMQALRNLLAGNTYCQHCHKKFTDANREVIKNSCLACFVKRHEQLTYTGKYWTDRNGVPQYIFLDGRGHVTLASPDSPHAQEEIWATLEYWGFSLPERVHAGNEDVAISPYRWHSLDSDPRKYAVIANYEPSHGAKHLVFLLKRDGSSLYLDRRQKKVRDMLAAAKQEVIAGKGKEDEECGSRYSPTDYMIYRQLARMVSREHDARQQQAS